MIIAISGEQFHRSLSCRHAKQRDDLSKRQQEELRNFFTSNGFRKSHYTFSERLGEGPHLVNGIAAVSTTQPFLTVNGGGYSDDNEPRSEGIVERASSLRGPKRMVRRKLLYRKRVATVTLVPYQHSYGLQPLRKPSKDANNMDKDVNVQ